MTTVAALITAALAAAIIGGRPDLLTARLGSHRTQPPRRWAVPGVPGRFATVAAALAGAGAGMAVAGPGGLLVGVVAPPAVLRWRKRRTAVRVRRRRERDVEEACVALAAELDSGVSARQALAAVAHQWPVLFAEASGRAMVGGDPAAAIRTGAAQPGAESLVAVAAAWEVSERTGAGLSTVLVAVADSLRAESALRREADTHLASVRTTSRLMAALPVVTLALFSAGDGAAIDFLTRSAYGVVCMAVAAIFIAAGLFWVDRTARSVRSVWQA